MLDIVPNHSGFGPTSDIYMFNDSSYYHDCSRACTQDIWLCAASLTRHRVCFCAHVLLALLRCLGYACVVMTGCYSAGHRHVQAVLVRKTCLVCVLDSTTTFTADRVKRKTCPVWVPAQPASPAASTATPTRCRSNTAGCQTCLTWHSRTPTCPPSCWSGPTARGCAVAN